MVDDVTKWLEQLGLGRYAPVFVEQQIDPEVLSELTDEDLEKLGVPLGPRKKILKAIAAPDSGIGEIPGSFIQDDTGTTPPLSTEPDTSLAAWERMPGERKPVMMRSSGCSRSYEAKRVGLLAAVPLLNDALSQH